MRERHPFGLAGAARGVLHQREVGRSGSRKSTAGGAVQGLWNDDVAQAVKVRAQSVADGDGLRHGDEQRCSGIGENADVAAQVIGQLGRPGGRVDGYGHGTGEDHTGEGDEVRPAGRQHDRDGVAGHDVARQQPRRYRSRLPVQRRIGHVIGATRLVEDADMRPFGGRAHLPVKRVDQGRRGRRRRAAHRRGHG